jgi:hypothetical protein
LCAIIPVIFSKSKWPLDASNWPEVFMSIGKYLPDYVRLLARKPPLWTK